MTAGKNPRNFKKKGQKKKVAHPFQKKEWYNVHVPTVFDVRNPTITPCNRTAGQSKYRRRYRCSVSRRLLILKLSNRDS
jgi:ribosomal protein S3AE